MKYRSIWYDECEGSCGCDEYEENVSWEEFVIKERGVDVEIEELFEREFVKRRGEFISEDELEGLLWEDEEKGNEYVKMMDEKVMEYVKESDEYKKLMNEEWGGEFVNSGMSLKDEIECGEMEVRSEEGGGRYELIEE